MTADGIVFALQAAHVAANGTLFFALAFQGLLGVRIRRRRVSGVLQDFGIVKKHRALGPVLAALLPVGYLAGLAAASVGKEPLVRYPGHFAAGTALLLVAGLAVLFSKRIRGSQSPWRTPHFEMGLLLLCLFLFQIWLGLNILL